MLFRFILLCCILLLPIFTQIVLAASIRLGDLLLGGTVDKFQAVMVINKNDSYTNTSTACEHVTINDFNFTVGINRGRVTPFIVRINAAANDFTILAIGETRYSGVDYFSTGDFSVDFSATSTKITLEAGDTITSGFLDADANGNSAGSVIPHISGDSLFLTGSANDSGSGDLSQGIGHAPTFGTQLFSDLLRDYSYNITADVGKCSYQIKHDGAGLTCAPEPILIRACSNASCSAFDNTVDTTVTLKVNGGADQDIAITNGTSLNETFVYTDPNTPSVLSLTSDYLCSNTGDNSTGCSLDFAETGFRFYADSEENPIPTQLSGKPSNTGFKASTLKLQAVKTNPITGACEAALINNVNVELSASCKNPNVCITGNKVNIEGLGTNTDISTQNDGAAVAYTNVAMGFGNNIENAAEFVFTYPEAGQMQLHARYNIPDENGDPSGDFMEGSSNGFVVRPLGFYVEIPDNPAAQNAGQINSVFKKAGLDFTTTLKAVQWESGDDDDGLPDGIPDDDADLSGNTVTTNFGNETAKITHDMVLPNVATLPVAGVLGTLTNEEFTGFANGVATNGVVNNKSLTYDEVGIISFIANLTDNDYLGAGDIIGKALYVGRFIPEHFELNKINGDLAAYCDNEVVPVGMTFAYSGQMSTATPSKGAIRYSLEPSFTITAKSKNGVNTTKNYTGDFMKLKADGITRLTPSLDASTDGALGVGNRMKLTADLNAITTTDLQADEVGGVVTYTYHSDDNFVYLREPNAEYNKFTSDINLQIKSVIDKDGVTANDADGDFDGGDPANALDTVLTLEPIGVEIRFGRAFLANSFGPETSTLPQELAVQYFQDDNYILAADDICSLYNSDKISFGVTNEVAISVINIPPVNGKFDDLLDEPDGITRAIVLPASGTDNRGEVEVIYGIYPWLEYDWSWDGVSAKEFNEDPSATATFGLFRGNDRIIYQREVNN